MGITTLAKNWARKHIKVLGIDEGFANASISVDTETFEKLREFYISEGGVLDKANEFVVRITKH